MYSVILATMLAMGSDAPNFGHHHRSHGCHGCHGCYGGNAFGCHGCYGGCHGSWGCHGCYGGGCYGGGCYGGGCHGCWGGCYGSSISYSCHGCYGCLGGVWGCYGGCSGFVATSSAFYGCSGCCGGFAAAPVVAAPTYAAPTYAAPVAVQAPIAVQAPVAVGTSSQTDDLSRRLQRLENLIERAMKAKGSQEEVRTETAPAKITVNVPADARLWVDNVECPLTSAVRSFNTPALESGKTYYYTMRVSVTRNGQTATDSQRVRVTAGQAVNVDLTGVDRVATALR